MALIARRMTQHQAFKDDFFFQIESRFVLAFG